MPSGSSNSDLPEVSEVANFSRSNSVMTTGASFGGDFGEVFASTLGAVLGLDAEGTGAAVFSVAALGLAATAGLISSSESCLDEVSTLVGTEASEVVGVVGASVELEVAVVTVFSASDPSDDSTLSSDDDEEAVLCLLLAACSSSNSLFLQLIYANGELAKQLVRTTHLFAIQSGVCLLLELLHALYELLDLLLENVGLFPILPQRWQGTGCSHVSPSQGSGLQKQ